MVGTESESSKTVLWALGAPENTSKNKEKVFCVSTKSICRLEGKEEAASVELSK